MSSTCSYNMANFGTVAAEIGSRVWGTPANFNGFRFLAALLQGTLVVGVSQTLRRWTEGATYVRQGDHHKLGIGPYSSSIYFHFIKDLAYQCNAVALAVHSLNSILLLALRDFLTLSCFRRKLAAIRVITMRTWTQQAPLVSTLHACL